MYKPLALALALVLALPAMAGAIKYQSGPSEKGATLAAYKTWKWQEREPQVTKDLDVLIKAEIEGAFAKNGLRMVGPGEESDLIVTYNVGVGQEIFFDIKWEVGPYMSWWAMPDTREIYAGGVAIIVGDPKTGKAVWSGLAIAKGSNPQSFQVMRKKAPSIARKLADRYPK